MLCAKFFVNQTKFDYFKGVTTQKNLKKPYKCNFARNFKHINNFFKSNHFKKIIFNN